MKNLIQTTALAVLLSTLTGCGLYDTANQRSQLMGNLHEGMTRKEVIATLGKPEFRRFNNGIEQWEYHKTHWGGEKTVITLDFQDDKVIALDSYDGTFPPVTAYPPIGTYPPYPESQGYPQRPQSWFDLLYRQVKEKPFKDDRLKLLQDAACRYRFTCSEVAELLKLFNFDDERLEALEILQPAISDYRNSDSIIDSMTFISGEKKAKEILSRRYQPQRSSTDKEIDVIYNKVKKAFPSSEQLATLRREVQNKRLTCNQCVRLMSICDFDKERLEFLKILAPHIKDYYQQQVIIDAFTFSSGKKDAQKILNQYLP